MTLRFFVGLMAVAMFSAPVLADEFSMYGVWGQGSQPRTKDYSNFSVRPGPQALGVPVPKRPRAVIQLAQGGARPPIEPEAPGIIPFDADYAVGDVVIDTSARTLYVLVAEKQAYAYPIAVGKAGFTWTGTETVSKVVDWPDWLPPEEMRDRKPSLPIRMTGGVKNPLGAKAIYLGNTLYRIHGTNEAESIGEAASSGCFRMLNAHVVHLASLVNTGTVVHVLKRLPAGGSDTTGTAAPQARNQT